VKVKSEKWKLRIEKRKIKVYEADIVFSPLYLTFETFFSPRFAYPKIPHLPAPN
jgi:hypothetical protein